MFFDDCGPNGSDGRVHGAYVQHRHDAAFLRFVKAVRPGVTARSGEMFDKIEYLHRAIPHGSALKRLSYGNGGDPNRVAAMQITNSLLQASNCQAVWSLDGRAAAG